MQYHGFPTLSAYEAECSRLGFAARRVGCTKDGRSYFALVTSPPGHPTGTSVESWTLFSADEARALLDGVNFGGPEHVWDRLAAHGYTPVRPEPSPAPEQNEPEDGFVQLFLPL